MREGVEPEGQRRGVRPLHTGGLNTHTHIYSHTLLKIFPLTVQEGHCAHTVPKATTQEYAREHILLSHHISPTLSLSHTQTHIRTHTRTSNYCGCCGCCHWSICSQGNGCGLRAKQIIIARMTVTADRSCINLTENNVRLSRLGIHTHTHTRYHLICIHLAEAAKCNGDIASSKSDL